VLNLEHRLEEVRRKIAQACRKSGRDPQEIDLVVVTKAIELEQLDTVYQLGVRDFGENRVQELLAKREQSPRDIRWHFIGHLQTNKVKKLIGQTALIHSIDRLELARKIQEEADRQGLTAAGLVQVNVSREAAKQGFDPESVFAAVGQMASFDRLNLCGLMTIGPHVENPDAIRASFRMLATLKTGLQERFPGMSWRYLSMGMSSDYEIAVEEGANVLRIGTAIFGSPEPE